MMNWTEVIILLINATATTFAFSGVLYSIYRAFSGEKIPIVPLFILLYIVNVITGSVAISYLPLLYFAFSFVLLYLKKFKFLHSILSCLLSMTVFIVLMMLENCIVMIILAIISSINAPIILRHEIAYNIYNSVLFAALAAVSIYFINKVTSRMKSINIIRNSETGYYNKKHVCYLAIGIVAFTGLISIMWFLSIKDGEHAMYFMSFSAILSIIVMIFVLVSVNVTAYIISQNKREFEIEKDKELAQVYKTEIQSMYDEIRDFKHDYMKIYSSMSVLLKENKIDELKDFFDKEITPLQSNIMQESSIGPALTLIDDSIVQGVIYNYVIKAKNGGIDFHIDVRDKIPASEKISSLELSRILGIILDNAFEEAVKTEAKEVQFGIVNGVGTVYVVKNTYSETPDLSKIFDKSYSTKGTEHGRGLAIVKGICDKYEEIDLSVKIQPSYFVCELMM